MMTVNQLASIAKPWFKSFVAMGRNPNCLNEGISNPFSYMIMNDSMGLKGAGLPVKLTTVLCSSNVQLCKLSNVLGVDV